MAYLVTRQFEEEAGGPLSDIKKEDKEKLETLNKELAAFDHLKPQPLPKLTTATDFSGTPAPTVIPDTGDETPIEPGFLDRFVASTGWRTTNIPGTAAIHGPSHGLGRVDRASR